MPYDRKSPADRQRVARAAAHALGWEPEEVPAGAVDQFAAVWNRVYKATGDESTAFAVASGAVQRREHQRAARETVAEVVPPDLRSGVAGVGATLARVMTTKLLENIRDLAENCDCGGRHANTLRAVRYALDLQHRPDQHQFSATEADAGYRKRNTSVDEKWAWNIAAKEIYRTGDKVFLAVREMLQNSRDAGAHNIWVTWAPNIGGKTATLTFQDDGKGMDAALFEGVFVRLGGSAKDGSSIGGFGAAKAAILTAGTDGWDWEVRTRDIHAVSTTDGAFNLAEGLEYQVGAKVVLRGVPNQEIDHRSPVERIRRLVAASDLTAKDGSPLNVSINGTAVSPFFGTPGKNETRFESGWDPCSAVVRSFKSPGDGDGAVFIRVGGLFQFSPAIAGVDGFARDYVVDIHIPESVRPGSDSYPFTAGRDAFRYGTAPNRALDRMLSVLVMETVADRGVAMSEFMEIKPDSTDPREVAAEKKLADIMATTFGSARFMEALEGLGALDQAVSTVIETVVKTGAPVDLERESDRRDEDGAPGLEDVATSDATPEDKLTTAVAWIGAVSPSDGWEVERAVQNLQSGEGTADDVEKVTDLLNGAIDRTQSEVSPLILKGAVQQIADILEQKVVDPEQKAELKRRKKLGELNPFGKFGELFFHRSRYDQTVWELNDGTKVNPAAWIEEHVASGTPLATAKWFLENDIKPKVRSATVDTTRSTEFLKNAKKYMKHLAWWDFTTRAVLRALRSQEPAGGPLARAKRRLPAKVGTGFVLADNIMGLTVAGGGSILVNPEMLDAVIQKFKDNALIAAGYIHGTCCHELAHVAYDKGGHDEGWSVTREGFAEDTLFLLPHIAEAGAKLFKMKLRGRAAAAPRTDELNSALARVAEVEAKLGTAEARLAELRSRYREVERDLLAYRSPLVHQIGRMVELHDFRQWLSQNPGLLAPYGVSVDEVFSVLDEPEGMTALVERAARAGGQADHAPAFTHDLSATELDDYRVLYDVATRPMLQHHQFARKDDPNFTIPGVSAPYCLPVSGTVTARGFPTDNIKFNKAFDGDAIGTKSKSKDWKRIAKMGLTTLQSYGIKLGEQIACGSYACAYSVLRNQTGLLDRMIGSSEDTIIAKFSGDPSDAAAWQVVINKNAPKRTWPNGLARVHCVEALPEKIPDEKGKQKGRRVYVMIQERMYPLTAAEEKFFNSEEVRELILGIALRTGEYEDADELVELAEQYGVNAMDVWDVVEAIEQLDEYDIRWHDLHGGNVMRGADGRLKIMDLGLSRVPDTKIAVVDA